MAGRHMADNSPSGLPPKDDDTIMLSSCWGSIAKRTKRGLTGLIDAENWRALLAGLVAPEPSWSKVVWSNRQSSVFIRDSSPLSRRAGLSL